MNDHAAGRTQDLKLASQGSPLGTVPALADFPEHILGKMPSCTLREASARNTQVGSAMSPKPPTDTLNCEFQVSPASYK